MSREYLTSDRTYYVRPDGNDSSDGGADSSASAWLTPQHAYNVIRNTLDIPFGKTVAVEISGSHTQGVLADNRHVGGGTVVFRGSGIIDSPTYAFAAFAGADIVVDGLEVRAAQHGLYTKWGGIIHHQNMIFGACGVGHQTVSFQGVIVADGDYEIAGNAAYHVYAHDGAIRNENVAVTITGTRTFNRFAYAAEGKFNYFGSTYSGKENVIGQKFVASAGGIIQGDQDRHYLPGNVAGQVMYGGGYFGSEILYA